MAKQNIRLGILLMVATTFVFSVQDALSRHLSEQYNVPMVVMIRFWFFAAFVVMLAARSPGGIARAGRPAHPILQVVRGLLLIVEVCLMVIAFTTLGLVETHAVFSSYPLLVAALSGPVLGEYVGWRRWGAIMVGFVGVLIILQPGGGVFSVLSLIPLLSASMFATYSLLTRYVAGRDTAQTSFFWTGVVGSAAMTLVGIWFWEPMSGSNWGWMGLLCLTGVSGHWFLIKCYEVAEASAVQPFAYLQLPFSAVLGVVIFSESVRPNVAIGAGIVVAAGLFTLWRTRQKSGA